MSAGVGESACARLRVGVRARLRGRVPVTAGEEWVRVQGARGVGRPPGGASADVRDPLTCPAPTKSPPPPKAL